MHDLGDIHINLLLRPERSTNHVWGGSVGKAPKKNVNKKLKRDQNKKKHLIYEAFCVVKIVL